MHFCRAIDKCDGGTVMIALFFFFFWHFSFAPENWEPEMFARKHKIKQLDLLLFALLLLFRNTLFFN